MGDIVDLGDYRRKKIEKAKGADTRFHPARKVGGVVGDAKREIDSRLLHEGIYNKLSKFSDDVIHSLGSHYGHLPRQMEITDLPNVDYNEVRWKLAQDPAVHKKLLDIMGDNNG